MKKFKKLVALLLAMMMIFSIAPVAALADELELRPIHAAERTTEDADEQLSEKTEQILPEEETAALTAQATDADNTSDADFARIFHLDCGRKYFSVSEIEGIIDQLAANYFTHIQLAFGNNGFRFLLDDMSVTANGTTYSSEAVTSAITSGNSSYSSGKNADSSMLSESDMNSIIAYAAEKGIEVIPMLNTPGHMDALVSAMETLEIRSTTGSEMSITSEKELGFIKALQKKYIDYFAGKGSTRYNFAADEYSFSGLSDTEYTAFAQYVNDIAAMVKAAGMIPMAYNDGINYSGKTTSVPFDKDIEICYWAQAENYASVQELSNAGFKIINNNDAWYYVLGDYLYSIWSSGQWGYEDALRGINNTPVTQAKNAADNEVPVVGSVLCCWCDGPSIGYTDTGVSRGTASARTQTNQESVYKLIQAMAAANPDYFKAEENPKEPEIVVSPAPGEIQAEKLANGNYKVAVKPNDTLTLTLSNSTAKLKWASNNADVAAVADGKVTFTGTAGTVIITAEPIATRNDASAKAPYAITFEVEERGNTPKTIKLKVGQTKVETIIGNNYESNVDRSEFTESVATVNVVGKDEVAGSVIYKEETKTISALAGTSTTWTKTNYYHKVGENYYPVYGMRESEGYLFWTTYTYYYGYSENDNSGNVREIDSSEIDDETVTVYTKSSTEAVPASTTITFKGVSKGTTYVTVGDIRYTIEVAEKTDFTIKDGMEIPITIVDYRADGLLFDWTYNPGTGYSDSYRYGLVHGKATGWGNSGTGVTATLNSETGLYEVNGTHNSVEQIEGTVIQNTNVESTATTFYPHGTDNSWSRAGLVKEELGANGSPVYTEATVKYVAGLLKAGYYNKITKNGNSIIYDTFVSATGARTIRNTSATEMSTAFSGSRTWDNITNAYDLAWYLLNYLYTPDTNMTTVTGTDGMSHEVPIYGMGVDEYSKIILKQTADGTYRFDASKNKTKYDTENGAIYEDDSASSEMFYPLEDLGYEQPGLLKNTSEVDGKGRNGNFTLRGESQFIYNEADNLYFQFKGDDDVYMFINGVLALDLGGSHGSNTKKVELNKLNKTKYNLEDGKIATFTFFYMERCSDASNFAIETNMKLTKRAIEVEKKGYDGSYTAAELASGAIVENGKSVAYDLIVTNKGDVPMSNIKFEDTDTHGANMAFGYGVETPHFTPVTSGDFTLSLLPGYRLYKTDANSNIIEGSDVRGLTVEELSVAVAAVTLEKNQSLHIRYIKADVTIGDAKMAQYTNTVKVTAESGGQTLTDSAIHEIYSYNAQDTAKDYVVDFGLPLEIRGIFDQSAQSYIVNEKLNLSKDSVIKYGELEITGTGFGTVLKYTLKKHTTIDEVETIKLDVKYNLGGTTVKLLKTIKIIPASTVYYEDDLVKFKNSNGTSGVATAQAAVGTWYTVGTKKTNVTQALDRLGDANVYGYDPAYADCSEYSLGSATKVTVDNTVSAESCPTATFTFNGTGFDIISLTDYQSGAIYIDVYKGNGTSGERVKGFFVNNYYGYKQENNGKWVVDLNAKDTLYQIPVIKASGLEYGTYTVVINVRYYASQDVQNKGEYSFWLDAIRVYDPTGKSATNLDYMKDKEGYPQFIKLRKELAGGKVTVGNEKLLFIDGGNIADITTYANFGPNNEVYLAKGQAISFKLEGGLDKIASVQIGAKAPNGNASLVVNNGEAKEIATATEMYYEISKDANNSITITNTGDGILSLTNLKVTYSTEGSVSLAPMSAEEQTSAVMMVRALFAPPAPVVFEPETFTVTMKNNGDLYVGEYVKVTVTTSDDVDYITVGDKKITRYTEERTWGGFRKGLVKTGKRIWSYYVNFTAVGEQVISVVAYDENGLASEAVENTVNVKPRSAWRGKKSEWHI